MASTFVALDDGSTPIFDDAGNLTGVLTSSGSTSSVAAPDTSIVGDLKSLFGTSLGDAVRSAFAVTPPAAVAPSAPSAPAPASSAMYAALIAQYMPLAILVGGGYLVIKALKKSAA